MSSALLAQRQRELSAAQTQLTSAQGRRRRLEGDIGEIENISERMRGQRDELRTQRTSLARFAHTNFPQWRGALRAKRFHTLAVSELVGRDFTQIVNRVEHIVDELARRRAILRNNLSETNSQIARLRSRIAALQVEIRNLQASLS